MSNHEGKKNMVEVPDHLVDQVRSYLESLEVQNSSMSDEKDECDDGPECEVKKILNHRKEGTRWWFQLLFTDGDVMWVEDHKCSCEIMIAEYLKKHCVNTAYLFCRVSTKEQDKGNSTSLDGQEAELRSVAATNPSIDRVRVYRIRGSAYRSIPATMKKVGEVVTSGDAILVWRADRLSRNIVRYLSWIEEIHERNVEIYSHNEKCSWRIEKLRFIQHILDAQKEAKALSERVKLSYKRKRARGDERVGGLPYGRKYQRLVRADNKKIIRKVVIEHPTEIAILRDILESTEKHEVVANWLNQQGRLKRGRKWSAAMVKRVRTNRMSQKRTYNWK